MKEIYKNVGFYKIWHCQENCTIQVKFLNDKEVYFFGIQLGHMFYLPLLVR